MIVVAHISTRFYVHYSREAREGGNFEKEECERFARLIARYALLVLVVVLVVTVVMVIVVLLAHFLSIYMKYCQFILCFTYKHSSVIAKKRPQN